MQSKLFQYLRTTTDADLLTEEINSLLVSLYETKHGDYNEILNTVVRSTVGEIIKKETEKEADIKEYLKNILPQIESLKKINVKIAFEPSESVIQNIFNWIQKNLGEGVIINFELDKKIIGGAEIIYSGKHYDGTLAKKFEEFAVN